MELGTDPLDADSDGDGYIDPHELHYGSDPNDAADRIYQGGMPMWPYNQWAYRDWDSRWVWPSIAVVDTDDMTVANSMHSYVDAVRALCAERE